MATSSARPGSGRGGPRPPITVELRDAGAAADLIEALRGTPPRTDADARRRNRLADLLDQALFHTLISPRKDTTDG